MAVRNSTGLLNQKFWTDHTFQHKSGFLRTFSMTSPETLNTKFAINELSFPLVTHTVNSDARFDSYGVLNIGQGAELIWIDWTYR
jgi:hypothetical protein